MGTAFLYRGLARGRMSVVAPVSGVGTALIPVVVGVAGGGVPTLVASLGIVLALPAIHLVAKVQDEGAGRGGLLDGTLAGVGFGLMFTALAQADEAAGLYPLAASQATSVVGVVATAVVLRQAWVPRERGAWRGLLLGPFGATAAGLFVLASQQGLLAIVSVVSSLYPAGTVVLAALVLHERVRRGQALGLALAAVAVSLVALG